MGKPRRPFVQSGIEHYRKKIKPYASLSLTALKEEPMRKGVPPRQVRSREGDRIQRQMDPQHLWIALDPAGGSMDSPALASFLEEGMNRGRSRVAFIIGGPHGLASSVLEKADLSLSLSRMTLSHELTLLVLLEQIYRSLAILNRLPYPR